MTKFNTRAKLVGHRGISNDMVLLVSAWIDHERFSILTNLITYKGKVLAGNKPFLCYPRESKFLTVTFSFSQAHPRWTLLLTVASAWPHYFTSNSKKLYLTLFSWSIALGKTAQPSFGRWRPRAKPDTCCISTFMLAKLNCAVIVE